MFPPFIPSLSLLTTTPSLLLTPLLSLLLKTTIAAITLLAIQSYILHSFLYAIILTAIETYIIATTLFNNVQTNIWEKTIAKLNKPELSVKGKKTKKSESILKNTMVGILTLPMNLLPGVGSVAWIAYNGYKTGGDSHALYYTSKAISATQQDQWIAKNRIEYGLYGVVIFSLGLIPIVGTFAHGFGTVVSAVWAAQLEAEKSGPLSLASSGEPNKAIGNSEASSKDSLLQEDAQSQENSATTKPVQRSTSSTPVRKA